MGGGGEEEGGRRKTRGEKENKNGSSKSHPCHTLLALQLVFPLPTQQMASPNFNHVLTPPDSKDELLITHPTLCAAVSTQN